MKQKTAVGTYPSLSNGTCALGVLREEVGVREIMKVLPLAGADLQARQPAPHMYSEKIGRGYSVTFLGLAFLSPPVCFDPAEDHCVCSHRGPCAGLCRRACLEPHDTTCWPVPGLIWTRGLPPFRGDRGVTSTVIWPLRVSRLP